MTLSPRGAAIRGDDYQHVIGWLKMCDMLARPAQIASVSVEDRSGRAFDDIVVRFTSGRVVYIQATSSVRGDKAIDWDYLSESKPKGKSRLQRWYDTYVDKSGTGERFTLEFWTPRGFDPDNPILGSLRDLKHEIIETEEMLSVGARSHVGQERDRWASHLGINVEELAAFLRVVRWKNPGSEPDLRQQAARLMGLAGLRADRGAVTVGVGIVRLCVTDALGEQTPESVTRLAHAESLIPPPVPGETPASADHFPASCREPLALLKDASPQTADRIVELLSERSSLLPGTLESLADSPPQWLQEADSLPWEILGSFLEAHHLPGPWTMRQHAIRLGSPRGDLYRIREATVAAISANDTGAQELLAEVAEDHPLLGAARARVDGKPSDAVAEITPSGMQNSDDPDLALRATETLIWAYRNLGELEAAINTARKASLRFPDHAALLMMQAELSIELVQSSKLQTTRRHELLASAADSAIKARDLFRKWKGPSRDAVALAAPALLALNDPRQVLVLAQPYPLGEATHDEAAHGPVVEYAARALLMLGRHAEIDELAIDNVNPSGKRLLLALQAASSDDPEAANLMRTAVEHADPYDRLPSLLGLAKFGKTDEDALSILAKEQPDALDLVRALVAYNSGDIDQAFSLLRPYRCKSAWHVDMLATLERETGSKRDAYKTLKESADALGDPFLLQSAVDVLVELEDYPEVERVATAALGGYLPLSVEMYMRGALMIAAQGLKDWPKLEIYGRSFADRFPDHSDGLWQVAQAIHLQGRNREAWGYLVEYDLTPSTEQQAMLEIAIYNNLESPVDGVERILRTMSQFLESEEVASAALLALMVCKEGQQPLSDEQKTQVAEIQTQFLETYPDSSVLWQVEFSSFEEMKETLDDWAKQLGQTDDILQLLTNQVQQGHMPYGILGFFLQSPYAEMLLTLAGLHLTAISVKADERQLEREAARAALRRGVVAADTSAAALSIHAELDITTLSAGFDRVLIADQLLFDAQYALDKTSNSPRMSGRYDPVLDAVVYSEVDDEEHARKVDNARRLVEMLGQWQKTPSIRIRPEGHPQDECLEPWDSSIRVALDKDCPLWCDDIAVRRLARAQNIKTFGTFALWEVLTSDDKTVETASSTEMKMRLLRARIGDVPISLSELAWATENSDGADIAVGVFLGRPHVWSLNPSDALAWYLKRIRMMINSPYRQVVPQLLYEACRGYGAAVPESDRVVAVGNLLAATLLDINFPALTPILLAATRYAAITLAPESRPDPLPTAVQKVLNSLESIVEPALAAQFVMGLFSETSLADQHQVASIVLGDR